MKTTQELNDCRRKKCLEKRINWDGNIMTLAQYLDRYPTTAKREYIQTHETKKKNLCYRELDKPITKYYVWHMENGRETGIEVPKLVFDAITL